MTSEINTNILVQRLRDGDESARNELIGHAWGRMRKLSRRMMVRRYPDLREVEQTDDVLQTALRRLNGVFEKGRPIESGLYFWRLTAVLIRRSLVDLARKHRGRDGQHPRQLTGQDDGEAGPLQRCPREEDGPQSLEEWAEFHEQVEALPDKEREMFGLRWYGGLSHEESATILGVSEREVKRRWQSARSLLSERLMGQRPH